MALLYLQAKGLWQSFPKKIAREKTILYQVKITTNIIHKNLFLQAHKVENMGLIYTSSSTSSGDGRRHGLYLGGKREAKSIEKLQQWNISHILNVTPTKEVSIQAGVPNYFEKKSTAKGSSKTFVYKRIPIYDSSTSVSELETYANEIVDFISKGLYHGSVLVHCHQGISRSTTCVLLFLMRYVTILLQPTKTSSFILH